MSAPQPQLRVGTRVRKQFVPEHGGGGGELQWFEGTIVDYDGRWWRVRYDDGDEDDNRAGELTVVTLAPPPRKAARTPSRPSPASPAQHVAGPASPPLTWKKKAEPAQAQAAAHVSQLRVAALPPALGPECVAWAPQHAKPRLTAEGMDVLALERYVRYLHRRHCLQTGGAVPEDAVMGCSSSGNVYRHLDTGTRDSGAALRAALRPLLDADASPAAAVEVLAQAVRAAVLDMAVGRGTTFRAWRAWQLRGAQPPCADVDAALRAMPCLLPLTDADLRSFEAYIALRHPETGDGDPAVDRDEAFFTAAYQSRGFVRTAMMAASLRRHAHAVAALLQSAVTWREATDAVLSRPGAFREVGPYFGGQALCCVYLCFIGGDAPDGPFRTRLMRAMDPSTMAHYATPGKGPLTAIAAIFGDRLRGDSADKMAWLAANTEALMDWAGLDFPWLMDGKARRVPTAVDHEHSLCYYHRASVARDNLRECAAHLHAALQACAPQNGSLSVHLSELEVWNSAKVCAVLREMLPALGAAEAEEDDKHECFDSAELARRVVAAAAAARTRGVDPAQAVKGGRGKLRLMLTTRA